MEIKKVKQLAMIGSGLLALSQFLFLVSNLIIRLPYLLIQLMAVAGSVLIFLFFYTLFEKEQKKNNTN
jgi:hypothetical protein